MLYVRLEASRWWVYGIMEEVFLVLVMGVLLVGFAFAFGDVGVGEV